MYDSTTSHTGTRASSPVDATAPEVAEVCAQFGFDFSPPAKRRNWRQRLGSHRPLRGGSLLGVERSPIRAYTGEGRPKRWRSEANRGSGGSSGDDESDQSFTTTDTSQLAEEPESNDNNHPRGADSNTASESEDATSEPLDRRYSPLHTCDSPAPQCSNGSQELPQSQSPKLPTRPRVAEAIPSLSKPSSSYGSAVGTQQGCRGPSLWKAPSSNKSPPDVPKWPETNVLLGPTEHGNRVRSIGSSFLSKKGWAHITGIGTRSTSSLAVFPVEKASVSAIWSGSTLVGLKTDGGKSHLNDVVKEGEPADAIGGKATIAVGNYRNSNDQHDSDGSRRSAVKSHRSCLPRRRSTGDLVDVEDARSSAYTEGTEGSIWTDIVPDSPTTANLFRQSAFMSEGQDPETHVIDFLHPPAKST